MLVCGRKSGKVIFIESLLFLSAHHIYRQVYDYGGWTLDITTALMMTTGKYIAFGWCYQDGDPDKLSKISKD